MQDRDQDQANTVPHQWNYHCTQSCKVPSLYNPSGCQSGASKLLPTLGYNLPDSPWTNDQLPKTSWALHILWAHMFWAAYWDTSVVAPLLQHKSWPLLHQKQSPFLASPLMELELCTSIINQFMCSNKLGRILAVPPCSYQHWMLCQRPMDSVVSGLLIRLLGGCAWFCDFPMVSSVYRI